MQVLFVYTERNFCSYLYGSPFCVRLLYSTRHFVRLLQSILFCVRILYARSLFCVRDLYSSVCFSSLLVFIISLLEPTHWSRRAVVVFKSAFRSDSRLYEVETLHVLPSCHPSGWDAPNGSFVGRRCTGTRFRARGGYFPSRIRGPAGERQETGWCYWSRATAGGNIRQL